MVAARDREALVDSVGEEERKLERRLLEPLRLIQVLTDLYHIAKQNNDPELVTAARSALMKALSQLA